ncbi:hypothetical protein AVEN_70481-1 [Araneus ventricosus]|uniref:Uncharacterized protein n=1 Tax=Araneus ventricosus TaxID=182803 RepID=A0A4Y2H233_ARAVE|nr:hypothetical protein AVEN_70481-1 [Araneus ventricosus]
MEPRSYQELRLTSPCQGLCGKSETQTCSPEIPSTTFEAGHGKQRDRLNSNSIIHENMEEEKDVPSTAERTDDVPKRAPSTAGNEAPESAPSTVGNEAPESAPSTTGNEALERAQSPAERKDNEARERAPSEIENIDGQSRL